MLTAASLVVAVIALVSLPVVLAMRLEERRLGRALAAFAAALDEARVIATPGPRNLAAGAPRWSPAPRPRAPTRPRRVAPSGSRGTRACGSRGSGRAGATCWSGCSG